jgi:hypothetical protein
LIPAQRFHPKAARARLQRQRGRWFCAGERSDGVRDYGSHADGSPRFAAAAVIVDSRTPLDQRWGDWYVTGTSGGLQHRGNAIAPNPDQPDALDLRDTENLTSLASRMDTSAYLEPTSDLIALMTLEHQTWVTNLLTRLGWETRIAIKEEMLKEAAARLDFISSELVPNAGRATSKAGPCVISI